MSAQMQETLEVITPEVNGTSLLAGTSMADYRARQKQEKEAKREAKRLATLARAVPPRPEDIAQREGRRAYVKDHANPWHQKYQTRLTESWERWNKDHFESRLVVPNIDLNEPTSPNVYGSCARYSGFGGLSQIRIRPSLLAGTHPHVRPENGYAEGRFLFAEDVLRHEMIHQWQQEVTGELEKGSHGHGKTFRDKANEIGATLGLAPVRTSKKRGHDDEVPSCAQWPHNVRSLDYYLGAYVPPEGLSPVRILCITATNFGYWPDAQHLVALCNAAQDYYKSTPAYRKSNMCERDQILAAGKDQKFTLEDIARIISCVTASSDSRGVGK